MTQDHEQQFVEEAILEDTADWAGWRAGQRAFQPGVPLRALPLRGRERSCTFVRRLWPDCTPRLHIRLLQTYMDAFMHGALAAAWQWAWEQGDTSFAAEVRACALEGDW